jgi:ubiquitin C-terminal hydrolase
LFIDWAQEDAHEFMKELLNSIHEDLNKVKAKPKYKQMNKEVEGVPL